MSVTLATALAPDNTNITTFRAWSSVISGFFATAGWIQQANTGQVVWTATVLTCTSVTVTGGNSVYAYSGFTGPTPRIGMSVIFSTFGTGGNNVTAVVTAVNPGVSVTVATTTQVNDTTGSGTTTALAAVPGTSAFVYEIWGTGDSVGFPIFAKVEYGTNSGTANRAEFAITIGMLVGTAGNLGITTSRFAGAENSSVSSLQPCHFSGDSGRISMALFQGNTNVNQGFSMERSYDNNGVATGSYYTMAWAPPNAGQGQQQTIFASGGVTVNETVGWCCAMPRTATTGNVGSTTHVSPVFPLVGGIGNPMTGVMAYRGTDIADNQIFYVTMYGTQQTYASIIYGSSSIVNNAQTCGFGVRFS